MPESFAFKLALNTVHVTVDDATIEYKIGVSKRRVPLADLRHLYVIPGSVRQLVVSYADGDKLKRITIGANDGQPAFDTLVELLVARRPEIDIRHLLARQANKLLGRSRALIFIGAVVAIVVGLAALTWLSGLVEGWFD